MHGSRYFWSASRRVRALAGLAVVATAVALAGGVTSAGAATSATAHPSATPGATVDPSSTAVTADALPTAQIDGVGWAQAVVGSVVYVGGKFTVARPAGSAPGQNTVARTNLLAYAIDTGVLLPSFAPVLNGQVKAVVASPDGRRIYVGGDFTTVDGTNRYRVAAFDTATGALITTFAPMINSSVHALAATNTTVYVGGSFSTANGVARSRLAAFNAADGALTTWNPNADSAVDALLVTPDGSRIIVGGAFANMGGQAAVGLAAVDPTTGSVQSWAAGSIIRDAGSSAAILSLSTDGSAVYGTGYVYSGGGNFEGTFSADPDSGTLNWLEDCHGDTYGAFATGSQVYTVSHAHYCGNIGGFGETIPRTAHRALAFTTAATGTATADPFGYTNFAGNPTPSPVNWFPDLAPGTVTGQGQAAWTVSGNSTYVVLAGEFPSVNGIAQQGLVRFATRPTAPSKQGPMATGSNFAPRLLATSTTSDRITWQANWDRDNTQLTYRLSVNGSSLWSGTLTSTFWNRPIQTLTQTGLTPGVKYKYQLTATDPSGNTVTGAVVTFTAPTVMTAGIALVNQIIAAGPISYYPLNETTGSTALDQIGFADATSTGSITRSTPGVTPGDVATTLNAPGAIFASTAAQFAPFTYTQQAWLRTTSTAGGLITEFSTSTTAAPGLHDREVYLRPDGHVVYAVYTGANGAQTLVSPTAVNDGKWHQVTASESPSTGTALFIDGTQVGSSTAITQPGFTYNGVWRFGTEDLSAWPTPPTSTYLTGDLADVAFYPTVLPSAAVNSQYAAAGLTNAATEYTLFAPNSVPTQTAVQSTAAVALGLVFSSSVNGHVDGIRFYKGPGNIGPHTVTLWSASGTALATATTTAETATGWQTAYFATPVAIAAGTDYEASYYDSAGYWSEDDGYLNSPVTNGPLTANSGSSRYTFSNGFPNASYQNANYWVDPLFHSG